MKQLGGKGFSLPEVMTVMAILGMLVMLSDRFMQDYILTVRLQSAADMIGTDIRKARYTVYTGGEPYCIDFEPATRTYIVNGKDRMQLPPGISFGSAKGVTGRPSEPYAAPPKDGITFHGEGTENRAEFLPKGIVVPTGAVYLTNGKETLAITVMLNGHTTTWRSKGGSNWIEI